MKRIVQFLEDRQSTLASGLAALLIIVVGFLVFNYISEFNKTKAPQVSPEATKTAQVSTPKVQTPPAPTPSPAPAPQPVVVSQPAALSTSTTALPLTYTVVKGDSLVQIAQKFYGDANKWTVIAEANHLANPSTIHTGNVFIIPKLETATQASAASSTTLSAATSTTVKPGTTYIVQSGDTLWDLAIQAYGSGYEWYRIDQANSPLPRTANGRPLITAGQRLKIP